MATEQVDYNAKLRRDLLTIAAQVEYILQRYPAAKNSDTMLQFIWLRIFKGINVPFTDFQQLQEANLESVRRMRQKYNEKGLFLPTNYEVAKRRKRKQAAMREVMPRLDPSKIDESAVKDFNQYGESL